MKTCFSILLFFLLTQTLHSQRFEYVESHMGTEFRIVFYTSDETLANAAAAAAFRRIDELEQIFSDYIPGSEVSRLSATAGTGEKVLVGDDLWKVLSFSQRVAKETKGAFDVTAGALTKLWRRAFRQKKFPEEADLEAAGKTVGYKKLKLYKKQRVELSTAGTLLDFGGVAKGYAVDEAMKVLKQHGISAAMIDGGGDIAVSDAPPGQPGWAIERSVYKAGKLDSQMFFLSNKAVATSGDTYRYLEWEGKRYSHILDPRTGMGVTTRQIVTVLASTCMEADAWATAMSVEADTDVYLHLKKKGLEVTFSQY
ncbi:MAG: FAD:protein FMN transferase [Saprospiraceae bacterium]